LIEGGYLYIAQPPLYKVKRASSEQYLKDQRAFEDYLIAGGIDDAVLEFGTGEAATGADLRQIVERARSAVGILDGLHSRYARFVVEQAAITAALDPKVLVEETAARALAEKIASRLDTLSDETERGWLGEVTDEGGLMFSREVRSVKEAHVIDRALIASADARKLNQLATHFEETFGTTGMLKRKGIEVPIYGPSSLLEAVYATGRKGISMQRYKGLGEMNPEQLWETTLNIDVRTLMQVKVGELDEADEIFSKLMGDVVEPRREFIQQNALSVANLDV
jgi:DNA gyrase subunit B